MTASIALCALTTAAGAASSRPVVSVQSWTRTGGLQYLTVSLCGAASRQEAVHVTESYAGGRRRLVFTTRTTTAGCSTRNVYWRSPRRHTTAYTLSVRVHDDRGAWSAAVEWQRSL